jgi:Arc/MetJ-type ribon-helix-helix transcriptional regulator
MGAVQLPDELQRVIEQQVAEGRATSTVAFLEEAVLRLVDEGRLEQEALEQAAQAGIADIEAGRYTLVATAEDSRRLNERLMQRLRDRLAADE